MPREGQGDMNDKLGVAREESVPTSQAVKAESKAGASGAPPYLNKCHMQHQHQPGTQASLQSLQPLHATWYIIHNPYMQPFTHPLHATYMQHSTSYTS